MTEEEIEGQTAIDPEEAYAANDDHLAVQTDNATSDEDGPQDEVDQDPIAEDDVIEDES